MAVDAFSSDSIPAHLITNECIEVYLDHLANDGIIAFHISNRYLNLEPVLANLCSANGLTGYSVHFRDIPGGKARDEQTGESASSWILIARDATSFGTLPDDEAVQPIEPANNERLWTDDYSNILGAFDSRL